MGSSHKFIILGGGNASGYAAREFVKRGLGKGELLIITDEAVVAYERPALSKAYLFPEGFARLPGFHTTVGGGGERQAPEWYVEKGIDFRVSTKIVKADVAAKTLTSDSGEVFQYEVALIVATGARPIDLAKDFKTPGADLSGILYLRDVADANALLAAIPAAKAKGGKVVAIGGGYIGLETAAALQLHALNVSIVFPESRFLERLFTPELASFYEGFYADKGIKILNHSLATGFKGTDGAVSSVVLKDGSELEASLVVVGVGAKPNLELFQGQLDMHKERPGGILVDSSLRTSDTSVYAIGDVAAFPLLKYGQINRQEHVTNARQTAAHAVGAIFGETAPYDYLPFFYSRVFNLSWQFYGISDSAEPVFFGSKADAKFGTLWIHDGKVVGGFLEGATAEEGSLLKKLALTQPAVTKEEVSSKGLGAFDASKL